jgi:DNA polymerase-3 subunit delta'
VKFSEIIGHQEAIDQLRRAHSAGRISHALLLVGPPSVGKSSLANALASTLLCEKGAQLGDPCGQCSSCQRMGANGHPDLTELAPEGAGEIISIKTLRERVFSTAIYAPAIAPKKVFLLNRADRLGSDASHSLLKILEEPPPYVNFILTSDTTETILGTILSRCRIMRVGTVSQVEIANALQSCFGIDPERAALFASYADGAPGKAIALAQDPDQADSLDELAQFCEDLGGASEAQALRMAERFRELASRSKKSSEEDRSSRLAFVVAFDMLAGWLRDAIALSVSSDSDISLRYSNREPALRKLAVRMGSSHLRYALESVFEIRSAILGNANAQLATEWLFSSILSK